MHIPRPDRLSAPRIPGVRSSIRRNVVGRLRAVPTAMSPWVLILVVLYAGASLALGLRGGLFHLGLPQLWELAILPPLLLFYPSLFEEIIFRGILLPRSLQDASLGWRAVGIALTTAAFTLWHPLNHYTLSLSDTTQFVDPSFLLIVVMLGGLCGYLCLRMRSIWPSIILHWGTTVVWNLFLGRPR